MYAKDDIIKDRYQVERSLGKGAFAEAYLVKDNKEKEKQKVVKVALLEKSFKSKKFDLGMIYDYIMKEALTISRLDHVGVIKYFDSFVEGKESDAKFYIVTEYCSGGDLCNLLEKYKESSKTLTETQFSKWAYDLACAISYIHEKRIVHRDIKTQNIFISDEKLKLGDFGLASDATSEFLTTKAGTSFYMAPELHGGKPYSKQVDMWAFGVVLYELCTYELPFKATTDILDNEPDYSKIKYNRRITRIIKRLLEKTPEKRIDAQETKTQLSVTATLDSGVHTSSVKISELKPKVPSEDRKSLTKPIYERSKTSIDVKSESMIDANDISQVCDIL